MVRVFTYFSTETIVYSHTWKISCIFKSSHQLSLAFYCYFHKTKKFLKAVQCLVCSVTKSCLTLYDPMDCSTPNSSVWHHLQEFPQIHIHWVSDAILPLILCCPLLLLLSIFPSIRVFSNELALCIRWPKYLKFQLQHQSFQWMFRSDFL